MTSAVDVFLAIGLLLTACVILAAWGACVLLVCAWVIDKIGEGCTWAFKNV